MKNAYIFDMDGTLVDNCGYHVISWRQFSRRYGNELTEKQILDWMGAQGSYYIEQIFGRRLPEETLRNASAIFLLYLMLFLTGGMVICCVDGIPLMGALFESASAIGTVGLSAVGTANLSSLSRMLLIFLMYFGRVGGLTMIYALTVGGSAASQYPQEQVTVG